MSECVGIVNAIQDSKQHILLILNAMSLCIHNSQGHHFCGSYSAATSSHYGSVVWQQHLDALCSRLFRPFVVSVVSCTSIQSQAISPNNGRSVMFHITAQIQCYILTTKLHLPYSVAILILLVNISRHALWFLILYHSPQVSKILPMFLCPIDVVMCWPCQCHSGW